MRAAAVSSAVTLSKLALRGNLIGYQGAGRLEECHHSCVNTCSHQASVLGMYPLVPVLT